MTDYDKPLPVLTPLTKPFWDNARAGRLTVQRCGQCGGLRFPPSPVCGECGSDEAEWVSVSGRGFVWSFCEFHRAYFKSFAPEIPYNVALIRLVEGPRLYTNLVGLDHADIAIGMAVEAVFEPVTETVTLVKFRPSPTSE